MPLLKRKLELDNHYSRNEEPCSDASVKKRSNNVQAARSKNVFPRRRREAFKDAKTIAKMRNFRPVDDSAAATSLVSYSLPPQTPPQTSPTIAPETPLPRPANDNLIPVWELTGDAVKVLAATVALQTSEKPAVAFSFNLTPDAIAKATDSPMGFLDCLKRAFALELTKLKGLALLYWFAIDIEDGRLHIHGAFLSPSNALSVLRKIRQSMKDAWGEWVGPGKRKQVRFQTLYSDDWASYAMRNQRKVAKIIGPRTFTITQPLRREAERDYTAIRRIMRAAQNSQ